MRRLWYISLILGILSPGAGALPAQSKDAARSVKPINVNGIERLLHDRKGKILFLNVWATWCQPCVEEFPDLVKVYEEYRDSPVDIVAISVDYPDEIESKIVPFLTSLNVPFTVYVADVKKDEDFINALNPAWSGAVPATFIFDAHGKQQKFMFGQKNYETFKADIDTAVNSEQR
ncbi:MAG: TlpA disulfide reductase family protein [Bacteroidota bacterium]